MVMELMNEVRLIKHQVSDVHSIKADLDKFFNRKDSATAGIASGGGSV